MGTPRSQTQAMCAEHPMALPPTLSPDSIDCVTQMVDELVKLHAIAASELGATANANSAPPKTMNVQLKELVHTADKLKHNVQRSRAQIRQLPDMERTITEQEDEIADLERKIYQQKEVLEKLKAGGADFVSESQQCDA